MKHLNNNIPLKNPGSSGDNLPSVLEYKLKIYGCKPTVFCCRSQIMNIMNSVLDEFKTKLKSHLYRTAYHNV